LSGRYRKDTMPPDFDRGEKMHSKKTVGSSRTCRPAGRLPLPLQARQCNRPRYKRRLYYSFVAFFACR
jgi:hypothetical protein